MKKTTFTLTNPKTRKEVTKEIPSVVVGTVCGTILVFACIGVKEFAKKLKRNNVKITVIYF